MIWRVVVAGVLLIVIQGCRDLKTLPKPEQDLTPFYLGADLSYVNEMEDCGGTYFENGVSVEPYSFFKSKGANIVRIRLWNDPQWTNYSNLADVKKSIQKAKDEDLTVLLDFHYSDDWADPGSQEIPEAWSNASTKEELGTLVYDYTYDVLMELDTEGLLPEMVQVGNEINSGLLHWVDNQSIDWEATVYYLQKGISAVNKASMDSGYDIETMIHIAQPENADWWFPEAFANGLGSFDWIGLSYYPIWSNVGLNDISLKIASLSSQYNRKIMIVETAYPHSLTDVDNANNILGSGALIPGYAASAQGQKQFMVDLTTKVMDGGGYGVIYWEPAWISTSCSTRWGQGSHWDNATFFDAENNNEALAAFEFLSL